METDCRNNTNLDLRSRIRRNCVGGYGQLRQVARPEDCGELFLHAHLSYPRKVGVYSQAAYPRCHLPETRLSLRTSLCDARVLTVQETDHNHVNEANSNEHRAYVSIWAMLHFEQRLGTYLSNSMRNVPRRFNFLWNESLIQWKNSTSSKPVVHGCVQRVSASLHRTTREFKN